MSRPKEAPFAKILLVDKSQHSLGLCEASSPLPKVPFPLILAEGTAAVCGAY